MTAKILIIDAEAAFRRRLARELLARDPETSISEYDPAEAGLLPDEFSGAGNDVVLLGSEAGAHDSLDMLARFAKRPGFPPVVYLGAADEQAAALQRGASGVLDRTGLDRAELCGAIDDIRTSRREAVSTARLFTGDHDEGRQALIRGYSLVEKLSSSPHSSVYLANRLANGSRAILKVLHQVPDVAGANLPFDRFLDEFELIAGIEHPHIVRIYDLGVSDDHAHIAMEYLDGGDLKARIAKGVSSDQAVRYLREIASALDTVHAVGILHLDLKPANIMLRSDDSIALIDFGLARRMHMAMGTARAGGIIGTPHYMSPEQGHGNDVDRRSDLYALGVIFFEMLTGEKPYSADSAMGIIYKQARAAVPLLPPHLAQHQELINLLMAKKPEDRLQAATEVAEWL